MATWSAPRLFAPPVRCQKLTASREIHRGKPWIRRLGRVPCCALPLQRRSYPFVVYVRAPPAVSWYAPASCVSPSWAPHRSVHCSPCWERTPRGFLEPFDPLPPADLHLCCILGWCRRRFFLCRAAVAFLLRRVGFSSSPCSARPSVCADWVPNLRSTVLRNPLSYFAFLCRSC